MRLVTFRERPVAPAGRHAVAPPGERATEPEGRGGLAVGDEVVDLASALSWLDDAAGRARDTAAVEARYGRGILGFVEHAGVARPAADAIARARADGSLPRVFEGAPVIRAGADVTLLAPVPRPPSVRDGYAFRQHVETARRNRGLPMIPEFDAFPVFYFTTTARSSARATCASARSTSTASTTNSRPRWSWAARRVTSRRKRRTTPSSA
jgi:hypothetical protein